MMLTEFLWARISEDESSALAATVQPTIGSELPGMGIRLGPDRTLVLDPARVIDECTVKRMTLITHADGGPSQGYTPSGFGTIEHCCITCGTPGHFGEAWPCRTLRDAAYPYRSHPDYREEWT